MPGSFVSKQIRGNTYWYFQTMAGGRKHQRYLGRESPELLQTMRNASEARSAAVADEQRRRELVAMLDAGGMVREPATVTAVLRILDQAGVFRSGGVLVGTQPFGCYANMLGVRFESQSDARRDRAVVVVWSGGANAGRDLRSFHVRGRHVRVDFVRPRSAGLNYLLAEPVAAAIVGGSGILVNVPSPARFAFHHLGTVQRRKDLRQAEQLLEVLREDRPGDVRAAANALKHRPSMLRAIRASAKKIALLDLLPA